MKKIRKNIRLFVKGLQTIHNLKKGYLFITICTSITEAIHPFINLYTVALILNEITGEMQINNLVSYLLIMLFSNLLITLLNKTFSQMTVKYQFIFNQNYKFSLSNKTMTMDYANIEDQEIHRKRYRIEEAQDMNGSGLWGVVKATGDITKFLVSIILSVLFTVSLFTVVKTENAPLNFLNSIWVSIVIIIAIILCTVLSMLANSKKTTKEIQTLQGFTNLNRILSFYIGEYIYDYHSGMDIRTYNQNELIIDEHNMLLNTVKPALKKLERNQAKYANISTLLSMLISLIIYLLVALKAALGIIAIGGIVQYIGSINQFMNSFSGIMNSIAFLVANNSAVDLYFDFMEIPNKLDHGKLTVNPDEDEYVIEFDHVSFCYPGTEKFALKDFSFTIKDKIKVAIVGMNGSGKTTLIKLLCRLYDPTSGSIKINGVDIRDYRKEEYYKLFSVVFQDFNIFSYTVAENIASSTYYEESAIEDALNEAGFTDRLLKMENGIKSYLYKDIDKNGIEISGGEAQKIAIGRALYKNAPIVVLDEPTAALDPIAEHEIYSKLSEIAHNKLSVFISHRLSSCQFCDQILVLHNGELVQSGKHAELLFDKDGKYYELWNAQSKHYA